MKQDSNNNADDLELEVDDATADALTPKQMRALQALLLYPTQKQAALAAGISETTLWRFMREPAFRRRQREVGNAALSHAVLRMQMDAGDSVTVLGEVMRDKKVSASARVAAAKTIYQSSRDLENNELKSKIEEFEEFIKAKQEEDALDAAIREGR